MTSQPDQPNQHPDEGSDHNADSSSQPQYLQIPPSKPKRGNSSKSNNTASSRVPSSSETARPSSSRDDSSMYENSVDDKHDPPPDYTSNLSINSQNGQSEDGQTSHNSEVSIDCLLHSEYDEAPFAFPIPLLQKFVDPKNTSPLHAVHGLPGLFKGFRVDPHNGISTSEVHYSDKLSMRDILDEDMDPMMDLHLEKTSSAGNQKSTELPDNCDRIHYYGANVLPEHDSKGLIRLMLEAFKDKVLILLSIAAVISLALGLYQTFGQPPNIDPITGKPEPRVEWVEGVAIIVAIVIVVTVGGVNDWQKELQFKKLNAKVSNFDVQVLRDGAVQSTSVFKVLTGDILFVEAGNVVPVDGVLIESNNLVLDESAMTGETDATKKVDANVALSRTKPETEYDKKADPYLISGTTVLEGNGKLLVTAVGVNSFNGRTSMAMRTEGQVTPLQLRLSRVADAIAKLGGAASVLLFVILLIEFLAHLKSNSTSSKSKGQEFLQILIVSVTLLVVAVPEGLPLAVTLALAFATNRMQRDNNLVRHLQACETMGTATNICSDKTGTLTENRMTVVAGGFGTDLVFFNSSEETPTGVDSNSDKSKFEEAESSPYVIKRLSPELKDLLLYSVTVNSTCRQLFDDSSEKPKFIGSKTETALLDMAVNDLGLEDADKLRNRTEIVQFFSFSSDRKASGALYKKEGDYLFVVKGMPEKVLQQSKSVITGTSLDEVQEIEPKRDYFQQMVTGYAKRSLRTLGFCYRKFSSWPPEGIKVNNEDSNNPLKWEDLFQDMTFLAFFGIMDPLRADIPIAVKVCQGAGVVVRMVTGDNIITAKSIASQCGIITPDGTSMEGPEFRSLSEERRLEVLPKLDVLARSSPLDKQLLIEGLQKLGNVVAVTGDGTNDAPALKKANVGFSMGRSGTEVAKEASDIILMDDNFSSIVKAIAWGRTVNDAVKKFLQFQITVNITAVFLTIISAVASSDQTSVLTAVQLLWVNLIMDTLAALALATDPPMPEVLERAPEDPKASLFTFDMWKMIIGQSIYQLAVTLVLHFAGNQLFHYSDKTNDMKTIVFNTFVWLQLFNELNNRRLDNKLNIFERINHNFLFVGIFLVVAGIQVVIVFFGGAAFSVTRIDGKGWAISIIFGVISIPLGALIRCIPNEFLRKVLPLRLINSVLSWIMHPRFRAIHRPGTDDLEANRLIPYEPSSPTEVIDSIRDSLSFVKKIRGGRIRHILGSKFDRQMKALPESVRPRVKRRFLEMRSPSVASNTSVALMVPISTLFSEASGRLGGHDIWVNNEQQEPYKPPK
ncbi:vacuolar calcium transporting P-type ATPase P2 type [Schizosaccharomyces cryophilus OY26]|uniref:Calcium-transporting ATPase n=1 Tax=Schizosaccharomyces cryophilus (strain OY26 / ATCC MYA-4695 / CBS 11777 / NBRC 106824 / NRRL Y48691) TaxID=653667 RepID=S9W5G6_SCHCR|nr:vacuolar calcium transporting P-type ATPase P2 type [Schizosaccharomyces cryophilus OY26]EPY53190.1 vacuolar calcium transporting P-type ATPase P2 type [Schizosaccharomyces cryophilus OY26]